MGLTKVQEVTIYDPITIQPQILCLLWDLGSNRTYHGVLSAQGGSGEYYWSIGETGIASISQIGRVSGIREGQTVARVNDRMNNLHFATAPVFVVPPDAISFLPSQVEVEVGSEVLLPLRVQAEVEWDGERRMVSFEDCRHLPLEITSSSEEIFSLSVPPSLDLTQLPGSSCLAIRAVASSVGHTKLTVTYRGMARYIAASVTLAAYPPLQVVDPHTGTAVVSLAASWVYVFEGGPQPWVLDPSSYLEKLVSETEEVIQISQHRTSEHEYLITCLEVHEQKLTFSVGNKPSAKNPLPASVSLKVSFACSHPVSMQLVPLPHPPPSCPLLQSQGSVPSFAVLRGRRVDVEVSVYDDENRKFDNFSSLQWQWSSSNAHAVNILNTHLQQSHRQHTLPCHISDDSLDTQLSAIVENYLEEYLYRIQKSSLLISPPLSQTILLLARSAPSITPSSLSVYNHPLNSVHLNVSQGSGHFTLTTAHPGPLQLVQATHLAAVSAIQVSPLNEGYTTLMAEDLCLMAPGGGQHLAKANLLVSGIYAVEIQAVDKVQVCIKEWDFYFNN